MTDQNDGPRGDDAILVELVEQPGAPAPPAQGRLGVFYFAILVPTRGDLGRFFRHLAETGVRPGASDHHVSEALYLRDPDGLGIEVYADRPATAWDTRERTRAPARGGPRGGGGSPKPREGRASR